MNTHSKPALGGCPANKNKTFVLGLGAQKCGTTWVHNYLSNLAGANFGIAKEYHVFDSWLFPDKIAHNAKIRFLAQRAESASDEYQENNRYILTRSFIDDPEKYFDYFKNILDSEQTWLTGDITPSYACLDIDTLSYIKNGLESRGIRVRPIFLMRDPVDRLQSAVRMFHRKRNKPATAESELRKMHERHLTFRDLSRGNYKHTIAAATTVFGEDIFYGFYEELFQEQEIRRLCAHIDADYEPANFQEFLNYSKTDNVLEDADRQKFALGYKDIYEFCQAFFGHERINSLWTPPYIKKCHCDSPTPLEMATDTLDATDHPADLADRPQP